MKLALTLSIHPVQILRKLEFYEFYELSSTLDSKISDNVLNFSATRCNDLQCKFC